MTDPVPDLITTPDALQQLVDRLAGEKVVAFDLEADSLHHYTEKVCLIQLAGPGLVGLIDPLACRRLAPLGRLLANPAVCKVAHGADYDIRSLFRDFGMTVANLFDTMIACQFLGKKEVGLAAVLQNRFGVELDKRFQKADWSRRPLTAGMIDYAARDTVLLAELHRQLVEELTASGRLAWVEEECRLLTGVRPCCRADEPMFLRFKGANRLAPRNLAVLEGLLRYRDEQARRVDRPSFKVLPNEALAALVERLPTRLEELSEIIGLSPRLMERHGVDLLAVMATALALPDADLPIYPQTPRIVRSEGQERLLRRLKEWRQQTAATLGIEPGILANNALLEGMAERAVSPAGTQAALSLLKEWQRQEFGASLATLLG